jgi:hypothetical protein
MQKISVPVEIQPIGLHQMLIKFLVYIPLLPVTVAEAVLAVSDALPQNSMEHLLEAEDDISNWEADQLMLEIDDALNDNAPKDQPELPDVMNAIHSSSRVLQQSDDAVAEHETSKAKINISPIPISSIETDEMGFPLSLFTKVVLLQY